MKIQLKVKRVLTPFSFKDVTLYPVDVYINEPYGLTVNALKPIPVDCKFVNCELKSFGKSLKLGNVEPVLE